MIDLTGDVEIGADVIFTRGNLVYTHRHPMGREDSILTQTERDGVEWSSLVIGDDVYFGANSIVLESVVNIPKGTVLAAGAVLATNPQEEYEIWGGVPAQKIGERE